MNGADQSVSVGWRSGLRTARVEVAEELKDAESGRLSRCLGEQVRFVIANKIYDEGEFGVHVLEPKLFLKPILVAAIAPAGEVGRIERNAVLGKFRDDGSEGTTVIEHGVNEEAQGLRQAADLAVGTAGTGACDWGLFEGMRIWIHRQ